MGDWISFLVFYVICIIWNHWKLNFLFYNTKALKEFHLMWK